MLHIACKIKTAYVAILIHHLIAPLSYRSYGNFVLLRLEEYIVWQRVQLYRTLMCMKFAGYIWTWYRELALLTTHIAFANHSNFQHLNHMHAS
jgi:hypothetical protein